MRSRKTSGPLRVRADLHDLGERCGKNRIARLMREQGLRPAQKRRFRPTTTDRRHPPKIAENWLSKVPAPDRPGMVWQSDFTDLETAEGWLFLAFTLDGGPRRCVAHHCRADLRVELTTTTFTLATQSQPPPPGLLHHSDRGVQDAAAGSRKHATYKHSGVEAIFNLTNPTTDFLGSALYLEALVGNDVFELEGKLLLQKNFGPVIVAYNALLEAEWEGDDLDEQTGEFAQTLGVSVELNRSFSVGAELVQ